MTNTDSILEESSSEDSGSEIEFDEETLIRYYFQCGFSYEEILPYYLRNTTT